MPCAIVVNMLQDKKVLITGGAGFIGSNLARYLCDRNKIAVLDDLSLGRVENLKGADMDFIKGDILDPKDLAVDAEYIFHLAAIPGVPQSLEDPVGTTRVSVMGTMQVLERARKNDAALVFASTCAVYGNNPDLPLTEESSVEPLSPYAAAKLTCEHMIRNYREVYGLDATALRFFNVYGPRQDPESYYSAVIPTFINRCLSDKPPIIYGTGEQTRDFVFVGDLVEALEKASERTVPPVINIGTGREVSVLELADKIMSMTGYGGEKIMEAAREGEVPRSAADPNLARKALDWVPKHDLESGLEKTIAWFNG